MNIYNNYKSKLTTLSEANDRRDMISEAHKRMLELNHEDYNLTAEERDQTIKAIIELEAENEADKKQSLNEILEEINKRKGK